ncbi:hypothetical protein CERSUDRAFT_118750 [Gelatoporia subvermispora B]|uniref:UBC core domain-containing protein n=1 Tax=Ceriporiopsis subvermispora (strain B) TaxID=914234 RepID=M2PA86_CERS8|nr:hypothetical protein CERSUDRAFT_118750 [Gelatoporia subvermispora B]
MPPGLSSSTTLKRIHREIADLKKEDLGAISLGPSGDDMFNWTAAIPGPEGSCYEGGVFFVDISLARDYPFSAPKVTFRTRIYHMNISERGNVCIDILKHNWSPALSLFKLILSLSSLLTDPNPRDPLVPSIATEYIRDRPQHDRTARHWTELYALPKPSPAAAAPVASAKAKGKARATDVPVTSVPASTSVSAAASPRATTDSEVITISDEEDNVQTRAQTTTAAVHASRAKRKRTAADTEIDLTGSSEEDAQPVRKRRPRVGGSVGLGAGATSGDVIVIED